MNRTSILRVKRTFHAEFYLKTQNDPELFLSQLFHTANARKKGNLKEKNHPPLVKRETI
jgi:hypothetical protein